MIKILAKIKLFDSNTGRKTPFGSGYRPIFSFIEGINTSGQIKLLDRNEFQPGDEGEVEIIFLDKEYLGANFGIDSTFIFREGREPLGEGNVTRVLNL